MSHFIFLERNFLNITIQLNHLKLTQNVLYVCVSCIMLIQTYKYLLNTKFKIIYKKKKLLFDLHKP